MRDTAYPEVIRANCPPEDLRHRGEIRPEVLWYGVITAVNRKQERGGQPPMILPAPGVWIKLHAEFGMILNIRLRAGGDRHRNSQGQGYG